MSIIFSLVKTEDDQFITVFAPGRDPLPASSTHPNFKAIVAACVEGESDVEAVCDLFDIAQTVAVKFQKLSDRVVVENGVILLDGDPVHGVLQDQILDFVEQGEDFGPLVKFYEKLLTNPLGNVQEGLFSWIKGQTQEGNFTITPEGNIIGYKSMQSASPAWREGDDTVFIPSQVSRHRDRVNGVEVPEGKYIEQRPGDTVEMPRSKVLNNPSRACGDGLHIGTYQYAKSFYGDTVMLVEFSPRDIVSLPDSNSEWKLRVCRYTVLAECDGSLESAVYGEVYESDPEEDTYTPIGLTFGDLDVGDRFVDEEGDEGYVVATEDEDGDVEVQYDGYSDVGWISAEARVHGKGGPTSESAKGNGRNAYQDAKGRFSTGRPGSQRDAKTGRFSG